MMAGYERIGFSSLFRVLAGTFFCQCRAFFFVQIDGATWMKMTTGWWIERGGDIS